MLSSLFRSCAFVRVRFCSFSDIKWIEFDEFGIRMHLSIVGQMWTLLSANKKSVEGSSCAYDRAWTTCAYFLSRSELDAMELHVWSVNSPLSLSDAWRRSAWLGKELLSRSNHRLMFVSFNLVVQMFRCLGVHSTGIQTKIECRAAHQANQQRTNQVSNIGFVFISRLSIPPICVGN